MKPSYSTIQTGLRVPRSLYKAIKTTAALNEMKIGEFASYLLIKGIQEEAEKNPALEKLINLEKIEEDYQIAYRV